MDIILIPGLWLDASSWDGVTPALTAAGHTVHPLTMPGMESRETPRHGIRLADWVAHVVATVDGLEGPVVVVGHSGGGLVAASVADARPDRVARVIYVDSGPVSDGGNIFDGFPVVNGEIPLPEWSTFEAAELKDLTDDQLTSMRERAVPVPEQVPTDPVHLTDLRRYAVPTTVVASALPKEMVDTLLAEGHPWMAELSRMTDRTIVGLPTGHWPQLTKPGELAQVILEAIE